MKQVSAFLFVCLSMGVILAAPILQPAKLNAFMFTTEITGEINPLLPTKLAKSNYWPYPIQTYEIDAKKVKVQILPSSFPATQVYAYGGKVNGVFKYSYPGPAIIAFSNTPTYVIWTNSIEGKHILPVDKSPPFDMVADFFNEVPIVPHVHGLETEAGSDGQPMGFWTKSGRKGRDYFSLKSKGLQGNQAIFRYHNTKEGLFWFHDHTMAMTRLNVYAGLVGQYQIVDPDFSSDEDKIYRKFGEIQRRTFAIIDKTFNTDGSLYYPNKSPSSSYTSWVPEFFGNTITVNGKVWPKVNLKNEKYRFAILNGCQSRYIDISFENNGKKLDFHLFRRDSDFLKSPLLVKNLVLLVGGRVQIILDLTNVVGEVLVKNSATAPFPIGDKPDNYTSKIMKILVTKSVRLLYTDAELSKEKQPNAKAIAQPSAKVVGISSKVRNSILAQINNKMNVLFTESSTSKTQTDYIDQAQVSNAATSKTGKIISIKDMMSSVTDTQVQRTSLRDTATDTGYPKFSEGIPYFTTLVEVANNKGELSGVMIDGVPLSMGCAGSYFKQGQTYDFYIINLTMDDHPIHIHLINFQIVGRFSIDMAKYKKDWENLNGKPRHGGSSRVPKQLDVRPYRSSPISPPQAEEKLFMDVIRVPTGRVTIARMKISNHQGKDFPFEVSGGKYVWHCHILEHEDNEMMRYFCIE